ncbi:MAG: nuclease-related domain-containing protein [Desulfococcaceae bacterium]
MIDFLSGIVVGAAPFLLNRLKRIPQNDAEIAVSSTLRRHFSGDAYHLLDNVTLRHRQSTTQIDHVLVSQYGIFVIETKGYRGWIYGNEADRKWTQVLYRAKFRFGNPIQQNAGHVAAVRSLFKLEASTFHSVVVFCGQPEFKTELPANVIHYRDLGRYIAGFTDQVITYNQLVYTVGRIETQRLSRSREIDEQHRNSVAERLERRTRQFRRF